MARKLPIGIQSFEGLRKDGYLYVDKTSYVYRLVHEGKPYFLCRPRRFGKSLLVTTLKAYWEGKRALFEGLAIEELEGNNPDAWQPHPIFHFDFNGQDFTNTTLEEVLDSQLRRWEDEYSLNPDRQSLGSRFEELLATAHARYGRRCVVLVDEYDKPLLDLQDLPETVDHNRSVFKGFFGVLKKADDHLRFVFITGVTKFSKVSVYSDLNQLRDISLTEDYSGICGITEQELLAVFGHEIDALARRRNLTAGKCLDVLRERYDGYCFHPDGPHGASVEDAAKVYNPFSLLNALASKEFGSYWFESGTPTFLVRRMRESGFDPRRLVNGTIWATRARLSDYRAEDSDPIPLLYQTGYLTISDYDGRRGRYTLTVPNGEVEYGLLESLAPEYAPSMQASRGEASTCS